MGRTEEQCSLTVPPPLTTHGTHKGGPVQNVRAQVMIEVPFVQGF